MISEFGKVFSGWRIVILALAPAVIFSLFSALAYPNVEGVRLIVSMTARVSALVFCIAFSASAVNRLWPSRWSRWQLRNRRYLGLAFAGLQTLHAAALIAFAKLTPTLFATAVGGLTIGVFGAAGYLTVMALAITSFKSTAALIGPARWRQLHRFGSYFIWFILVVAFILHLMHNPTLAYANFELSVLISCFLIRQIPEKNYIRQTNSKDTQTEIANGKLR